MMPHLSLRPCTYRRGASSFRSRRFTSTPTTRATAGQIRLQSPSSRGNFLRSLSTTPSHLIWRLNDDSEKSKNRNRLYQAFGGDHRCASSTSKNLDQGDDHQAEDSHPTNLPKSATESMRERASSMRETARGHYQGFRDHPAESARQGAKSFGGMLRMYGPVFLGTYMSVYFATLGGLFLGVESGVMDPAGLFQMLGHTGDDASGETLNTVKLVIDFMEQHELTAKYVHIVEKRPEVANLAVAWIAVKFTEPLRLAVSLAITPRIARYFGIQPKVPPSLESTDAKTSDADAKPKENAPLK